MKTLDPKQQTLHSNLSEAIASLTNSEAIQDLDPALIEVGTGSIYVIGSTNFELFYLSNKSRQFLPQSFFSLVEAKKNWLELIAEEDRSHFKATLEKLAEQGGEATLFYRLATSRKSGWMPIQDFLVPIKDSEEKVVGYLGRFLDDSFRIQAMDTLVRRSWKEVSTALTRRFLHDFNNTIAGIYSLSELYAEPGSEAESMIEAMEHIRQSSIRAQRITQQMRELNSMKPGEPSYFDLEDLIREQEDYLAAMLPKGSDISFELSGESLPTHMEANRFKQALLHLASNANDAAGRSPKIVIRCRPIEPSEGEKRRIALVEFQDDGEGIKDRIKAQICDPFFTTKDPQTNVGMGLFIVKSFVEELSGSISVESEPEIGTTVSMRIPLADLSETFQSEAPAAPPASSLAAKPASKKPTVLVYTWEDVTRHPLISSIREDNWKYRIHLDPRQFILDAIDLDGKIDGILLFKSALDERAEPLISELARLAAKPPLAIVALGESIEALPEFVKSNSDLIASGTAKPGPILKKLAKIFS